MRLRSAFIALAYGLAFGAEALAEALYHLDIAPGDLTSALDLLARQTHVEFIYSADEIKGVTTRGVHGDLTAETAVRRLVEGTGFIVKVHPGGAVLITREQPSPTQSKESQASGNRHGPVPPETRREAENEIVVTASKRAEPLSQVAGAVLAISGLQLEERGANELADYLAFLPGVGMQSLGHTGYDNIFIRGIAPQSVGATTSTYIDDVPVGAASALTRGGFFTIDLNPTDLERVEVLKGPQGTLYGASSLGGVIKYVTRIPDLSRTELHFHEELATIEGGGTGVALRAAGSTPLIQDLLGVRLSGYFRREGGFINDLGVGGSDVNRANDRGARVSVLYRPSDGLSLQVTAMDQRNHSHGNDVVDFDPRTGRPLSGAYTQFRYVGEPSSTELRLYSAELTCRLSRFDLVAVSSYSSLQPVTVEDGTQTLVDLGYTSPTPIAREGSIFTEPVSKITQEIRLVSRRSGPVEWLLGGFFQHESLHGAYLYLFYQADGEPGPGPPFGDSRRVGTLLERAGFADGTLYLSGNLDLTAGFRVSRFDQAETVSSRGVFYNPSGPGNETVTHEAFSQTPNTYLLTARWRPNEDLTVYGRAASGYRPGGGRALPAGAPPDLPDYYVSDSLWSYESGLKWQALQHRLNIDLAGFWINWTHIQTLEAVGNVLVDGNAGTARSRGLELQARYSPFDGFNVGVNGAFTDAKFTETVPSIEVTAGEPLLLVGRWTTTVFSGYSHPIGQRWHIQTAGDVQYQSTRLDENGTPLPAYSLWNARAALSDDRLRITLFLRNITNKQALLGYGGGGYTSRYGFAVNPPRTFGIEIAQDLW